MSGPRGCTVDTRVISSEVRYDDTWSHLSESQVFQQDIHFKRIWPQLYCATIYTTGRIRNVSCQGLLRGTDLVCERNKIYKCELISSWLWRTKTLYLHIVHPLMQLSRPFASCRSGQKWWLIATVNSKLIVLVERVTKHFMLCHVFGESQVKWGI